MAKPAIFDIETLLQAGINPKTGLPIRFGNKRCSTKEDIKKLIRKNDEQIFCNNMLSDFSRGSCYLPLAPY